MQTDYSSLDSTFVPIFRAPIDGGSLGGDYNESPNFWVSLSESAPSIIALGIAGISLLAASQLIARLVVPVY